MCLHTYINTYIHTERIYMYYIYIYMMISSCCHFVKKMYPNCATSCQHYLEMGSNYFLALAADLCGKNQYICQNTFFLKERCFGKCIGFYHTDLHSEATQSQATVLTIFSGLSSDCLHYNGSCSISSSSNQFFIIQDKRRHS